MAESVPTVPPRIKHKSFTYQTALQYVGGRAGVLQSAGKPEFRVASPPEFKGEAGVWTPEDLFVAAVEVCTMTTFVAFALRLNLPLVSYTSRAEGLLEFVDGKYRFTKITLRPTIVMATAEAAAQAGNTLHDAHQSCLISNSVSAEVTVEPTIISQAS